MKKKFCVNANVIDKRFRTKQWTSFALRRCCFENHETTLTVERCGASSTIKHIFGNFTDGLHNFQSYWPWSWKDFWVVDSKHIASWNVIGNSRLFMQILFRSFVLETNIPFLTRFFFPDKRVKQLPLMDTPIPTAAFIIVYLAWVVVIGPLYMRDRKPYNLRNTLIYYNAFQVILSAYMFYEVISYLGSSQTFCE